MFEDPAVSQCEWDAECEGWLYTSIDRQMGVISLRLPQRGRVNEIDIQKGFKKNYQECSGWFLDTWISHLAVISEILMHSSPEQCTLYPMCRLYPSPLPQPAVETLWEILICTRDVVGPRCAYLVVFSAWPLFIFSCGWMFSVAKRW